MEVERAPVPLFVCLSVCFDGGFSSSFAFVVCLRPLLQGRRRCFVGWVVLFCCACLLASALSSSFLFFLSVAHFPFPFRPCPSTRPFSKPLSFLSTHKILPPPPPHPSKNPPLFLPFHVHETTAYSAPLSLSSSPFTARPEKGTKRRGGAEKGREGPSFRFLVQKDTHARTPHHTTPPLPLWPKSLASLSPSPSSIYCLTVPLPSSLLLLWDVVDGSLSHPPFPHTLWPPKRLLTSATHTYTYIIVRTQPAGVVKEEASTQIITFVFGVSPLRFALTVAVVSPVAPSTVQDSSSHINHPLHSTS